MDANPLTTARSKLKEAKTADGGANWKGDSRHLSLLLQGLQAVRAGDFSARLPTDQIGLPGKIADAFNDIVSANERMAQQLESVGQIVGREGKTRRRVRLGVTSGAWGEMEGSVNALMDDLLWTTTAVTHAIVAQSRKATFNRQFRLMWMGVLYPGEFLRSAKIVNAMIKQLWRLHLGSNPRGARGRH